MGFLWLVVGVIIGVCGTNTVRAFLEYRRRRTPRIGRLVRGDEGMDKHLDDDENVKAMRETAKRIQLTGTVVFIAGNLATVSRNLAAGDLYEAEAGVSIARGQIDDVLQMLGEKPIGELS